MKTARLCPGSNIYVPSDVFISASQGTFNDFKVGTLGWSHYFSIADTVDGNYGLESVRVYDISADDFLDLVVDDGSI